MAETSVKLDFRESENLWKAQATFEAQKNRELRHQHGKGPCNVFILDTSSSLGELGFKQMKDVFTSAIEEYAKHPEIDENVAVIVCGRETKFLRYFSNHYEDIEYCLDEVDLGGPSPLSAAFYLSKGCFMNGASRSYTVGEFNIQQRIILISGGRPTDFTSIGSKDNFTVESNEVFKNHLQELTREIGKVHPIFCIPVGINPDLTMLEFICYQSRGGKIVHSHQARQFAKYSQNMKIASRLSYTMINDGNDRERVMTSLVCTFPDEEFSEMDQDDIYEICSKKSLYAPIDHMKEKHLVGPDVLEERNPLMPPLGSRVKRGRDWIWNDQDGYGPGTVIIHCTDVGWLGVEWDTGLMYNYRYGTTFSEENVYDVQVCNEPRILGNKSISSGCEVKSSLVPFPQFRSRTLYIEEYPSFISFHNYSLCKSPVRTRQSKRPRGTPTGATPLQPHKFAKENARNQQWTQEERGTLRTYVTKNCGVPLSNSEEFWQNCATHLSEVHGWLRTGDSCRQQYKRNKSLFLELSDPPSITSVFTQTPPICSHSKSTFTEPEVPVVMSSTYTIQQADRSISLQDRADLLSTVTHGNANDIAAKVMAIKQTRKEVEKIVKDGINSDAALITNNKSVLYNKSFEDLQSFQWADVVGEMVVCQPTLANILLTVMSRNKVTTDSLSENLVPKLGLIYSILMQERYHKLSLVQRVLAIVLKDEQTHEKVFDRLEPIGITSSYSTLLRVIEEVGDSCYENILNELKNGKKYRLIGDNVNFRVGKKFQRSNEKQSQQYHWFASCAIIQNCEFSQYSDVPQGPVRGLDLTHILPSESDIAALKTNYTCHIAKVAKELIPALSFLATTDIRPEYPDIIQKKNGSILLPVQPLNEQCYSDVVKILDSYQEFVTEINEKSETSFDSIQIGGDQLTRERFSGAKTLRGGAYTAKERFENLYPISFELFHTSMNFLELMFKVLFKKKTFDKGTLNGEKVKLNRSSVHEDVKNHYDDDKDFVVSFVKSYIAAALMEFFGIKDRASTLTKNKPPSDPSELKKWQEEVLETFLDEYIFKRDQQITCTHKTLNLMLPDGTQIQIHIPLSNPQNPSTTNQNTKDDVYKYGVLVMELGLMFLEFQDVCKSPDRARLMTVMKCMMMMFKTVNNNSKYALEILRFLCFHQASYSLQTSYQSIHGLFVNTQGKLDSSIPADLHMEHMVKKTKSMLKSLGSNKTPEIIVKRSKALAGMDAISHHYDTDTNVILRSHHHKLKNANDDEIKMIQDIMEVNPFVYTPGRSFEFFKGLTSPLLFSINDNKYKAWVEHHKSILDYDSGK